MKGYRTVLLHLVMPLLTIILLAYLVSYTKITAKDLAIISGLVMPIYAALGIYLRKVTNTPIFKKD